MELVTGEQFVKALALLAAGIAMGFGAVGPGIAVFSDQKCYLGNKRIENCWDEPFFMTLRKVFRICTKTVHFQQENSEGIQVLVYFHTDFEKKANNFVFV